MANPVSPQNGTAEDLEYLIGDDGIARLKRSVGTHTPTGAATASANHAVVTHLAGSAIGATDELVAAGAKDPSGNAQPIHVDGNGNLLASTIGEAYVSTPVGVTCATTTGTLAAATYYYRVTATTAGGETTPSTEVSFAAGATTGVAITWPQVAGATGYKVYGRTTGAELLMATITNGTTLTWTDAGSVTPSGAMPTVNTATWGAALDTTLAAMSAKLPSALGAALSAASLPVVLATDGVTIGAVTETAPATDTASSGLNGRLQRIAQRLTSLIALLPAALGQGTMAQSLKVAIASDQSALTVSEPGFSGGILQSVTTVGTTAATVPATPLAGRATMLVQNVGATTIYLGSSTVVASTAAAGGMQLLAGQSVPIGISSAVILYAISSAAGGLVMTVEVAA